MRKYVSIPKVVEAEQFHIWQDKWDLPNHVIFKELMDIGVRAVIESDQSNLDNTILEDGNWIITDANGEITVMRDDEFKKTFKETDWG
jgi:hypothetical protein